MKIPTSVLRLKGFRFPREIIAYAVWAYHRFAMSTADVEDLLAEGGVIVSWEAILLWVNRLAITHFLVPALHTHRTVFSVLVGSLMGRFAVFNTVL